MKIVVGRSYRLRNGAKVKIINRRVARVGKNEYPFFVGAFDGVALGYTCQLDGRYSPVADGVLDIVGPAK